MKITIITGGSRGIGRSTALHCAARGEGVILTYNSHPEGAAEVVNEIKSAGGKALALKLDVGDIAAFPVFRRKMPGSMHRPSRSPAAIAFESETDNARSRVPLGQQP